MNKRISRKSYLWCKFLLLGLLILLTFQNVVGQVKVSEKSLLADTNTLQTNIEKLVTPYLQMQDFSGAILITQKGKILFSKGYGFADLKNRTPNTPQTRFCIGSINKQLTAATILLLEDKGKLRTEDTINKFFPDFPNGDKITIQHLLTHTSGLTKYVPYKNGKGQPQSSELIRIIGSLPPEGKPGERYNYSNAGFVLLALIVEKASGESFPQFIAENVFKPLKMKNSSVEFAKSKGTANGYVTGSGTEIVSAPTLDDFNFSTFSTVGDLTKWQIGLYGGKLLSPKSLAKMTTDYGNGYGYGLGISKTKPAGFGHDGVYSGYNGFVNYFPENQISLVYLGNIESGAMNEIRKSIISIAFSNKFETPKVREAVKLVETTGFQDYVGRYEVFQGFYLDVKFENKILSLRGPMGAFIALTPLSKNEFFYRHPYAKVTFVKDENQKVVRLDWGDASGKTYPCKKISEKFE